MAVIGTRLAAEALQLVGYVAVLCLAAAALSEVVATRDATAVARQDNPTRPVWLDQLPPTLGKDLTLLRAQDHYVTVETDLGQTMIRTTLNDAASELGAYGVQLHRSWWVARRAVAAYRYRKGAPVVVLIDGREIPVGRTYRRAVREILQSRPVARRS